MLQVSEPRRSVSVSLPRWLTAVVALAMVALTVGVAPIAAVNSEAVAPEPGVSTDDSVDSESDIEAETAEIAEKAADSESEADADDEIVEIVAEEEATGNTSDASKASKSGEASDPRSFGFVDLESFAERARQWLHARDLHLARSIDRASRLAMTAGTNIAVLDDEPDEMPSTGSDQPILGVDDQSPLGSLQFGWLDDLGIDVDPELPPGTVVVTVPSESPEDKDSNEAAEPEEQPAPEVAEETAEPSESADTEADTTSEPDANDDNSEAATNDEEDESADGEPKIPEGTTEEQWYALRECESRQSYSIVDRSGRYRGAYQFSIATWNYVAGNYYPELAGVDPALAAPADQDRMAYKLYELNGWNPWPTCRKRLPS